MNRQKTFLAFIVIVIICGITLFLNIGSNSSFQSVSGQNNQSTNLNTSNSSKIVVILPHPDDETIGMGGWIQKLKSEGHDVHCVLLTSGNGITDKVPLCENYYNLTIPSNATKAERKKIIREDSFKRVMAIYNCSYEMMSIDDAGTTQEMVYSIMEKKYKEGYNVFYTTTGDRNVDHLNCHLALKSMLQNYPMAKYRQFPVYWHASAGYIPMPIIDNYTDYDVSSYLPQKQEALEVYYNIGIFNRGQYKVNIERIYYIN